MYGLRVGREASAVDDQTPQRGASRSETRRPAAELGQGQIQAAVSSAQPSFEKCIQAEKKSGGWFSSRKSRDVKLDGRRVMLRINVQPDGKVTYPTFDDVTLRGTELGSCFLKVAKGMAFPAFEGKTHQIDIPLVLHD